MKAISTYILFWGMLTAVLLAGSQTVYSQQNVTLSRQQKQMSPKEKLAREYYKNKEYARAGELFAQLYNENPTRPYYVYYFNCLIYLRDFNTAEKLVKKQKKRTPVTRYDVDLAYVYDQQGETKKARNIIRKLVNNAPSDPNGARQLAAILQGRGYYDEALQVYRKAQQQNNGYDYNLEMANVYQASGDFSKMVEAYLRHLDSDPADMQRVKNRLQSLTRYDTDGSITEMLRTQLLEQAQARPENPVYAEMLLWYSYQIKDFDMAYRQARALDLRFGNQDEEMMSLAEIALSNGDFTTSAKAYDYVRKKKFDTPYYLESYAGYYHALVKQAESDPATPQKTYKELMREGHKALEDLGLNSETVTIAEDLGRVEAYHLSLYNEALQLLDKASRITPMAPATRARIKLLYADLLMIEDKVWDASLLYSQIEAEMKHEPIGHEAKLRNARLFYYKGEYAWAQTRLDVLKSATSKLIANDAMELSVFMNDIYEEDTLGFTLRLFGTADLLTNQMQYDSALVWLDKIEAFPGGPNSSQYVIYKKAEVYQAKKDYLTADSLYAQLYTYYPESIKADNALFRQAELNRLYLGRKDKAMELYLLLMTGYPESMYAGEARIRYRALRSNETPPPDDL